MLTEAHPVRVESLVVADRVVERPVTLREQVGIIVEKPISIPVIHEVPVNFYREVAIEVAVIKEVVVDRVIFDEKIAEVEVIHEVPLVQTQIQEVEIPVIQTLETEIPVEVIQQIPAVTRDIVKEIQIVDRYEERLVEVRKHVETVKEIRVVEQVPLEQIKYIEVEKNRQSLHQRPPDCGDQGTGGGSHH